MKIVFPLANSAEPGDILSVSLLFAQVPIMGSHVQINKPNVLFVGHRQLVQTQIIRHRTFYQNFDKRDT